MADFVFTNFNNLSISWINDGGDAKDFYPSGEAIDFAHGEERCCVWTWKVANAVRAGLVFVRCRRCKANGQAVVNRAGSLRLPCNTDVFSPPPNA